MAARLLVLKGNYTDKSPKNTQCPHSANTWRARDRGGDRSSQCLGQGTAFPAAQNPPRSPTEAPKLPPAPTNKPQCRHGPLNTQHPADESPSETPPASTAHRARVQAWSCGHGTGRLRTPSLRAGGMIEGGFAPPHRPCFQLRWAEPGTSKQSRHHKFLHTKATLCWA